VVWLHSHFTFEGPNKKERRGIRGPELIGIGVLNLTAHSCFFLEKKGERRETSSSPLEAAGRELKV